MSFIVTRSSSTGIERWFANSIGEVNHVVIRDLVETAPDFPSAGLSTEDRTSAAQMLVAVHNLFDPPLPKTKTIGGNTYVVEEAACNLSFPVELAPDDNGTILVIIPDVPGAVTFGDGDEDAMEHAVDALETVLLAHILDRQDIPSPSPANGRPTVRPTLLGTLKVMLYLAMRERGWRKADLARALNLDPRQVDRLLDLRHASTVKQLEQALAVCGKRADVLMQSLEAA